MTKEEKEAQVKAQVDQMNATIGEIVTELTPVLGSVLDPLLQKMQARGEPQINVLMGLVAFASNIVASGIALTESEDEEKTVAFCAKHFEDWTQKAVDYNNEKPTVN
jgi:hypothetical protein